MIVGQTRKLFIDLVIQVVNGRNVTIGYVNKCSYADISLLSIPTDRKADRPADRWIVSVVMWEARVRSRAEGCYLLSERLRRRPRGVSGKPPIESHADNTIFRQPSLFITSGK